MSIALIVLRTYFYSFDFLNYFKVKKEDNFKIREFESDDDMLDPFIKRKVPENILGQLAGELLLEKEKSFFTSGVVGVLCIGTKVSLFQYIIYLVIMEVSLTNVLP